jgi:hypothetical protein
MNKSRLRSSNFQFPKQIWIAVIFLLLAACSTPEDDTSVPTQEVIAQVQSPTIEVPVINTIDPTITPIPPTNTVEPTPTDTPQPTATNTPEPTATNTLEPTPTNTSTPTIPPPTEPPPETIEPSPETTEVPPEPTAPPPPPAPPTIPPEPVLGVNLIPNGSFEEGHYNQDGIPELQLPVKWRIAWDEGPTGVGNAAWDVYVRPEVSVLSTAFLPPSEHGLFIYNGQHTVKIFKGLGAVSFRFMTDVTLEPGTYIIEAKMFADIVEKWENREKVWAQDPYAAEFRFLVGDGGTFWTPQKFGQINVHNYTFTVDQTQTITVALAMRGRYAIANNGWFIDDISLRRIE